jgi:hypothetical protein
MSTNRDAKPEKKAERGTAKDGNPPLLFVDAIENGRARLLLGRDAFEVPAALLPPGAREGSWLRWSLALAPAPADDDQGAALRAKLGRGDDGGDIDL